MKVKGKCKKEEVTMREKQERNVSLILSLLVVLCSKSLDVGATANLVIDSAAFEAAFQGNGISTNNLFSIES